MNGGAERDLDASGASAEVGLEPTCYGNVILALGNGHLFSNAALTDGSIKIKSW